MIASAKGAARHLAELDGLRFLAACFVMSAHLSSSVFKTPIRLEILSASATLAGLGMTLFFVLSGFVIHYNYRLMQRSHRGGDLKRFAIARIARLYPLFLTVLLLDIWHASRTYPENLEQAPQAALFYLTLTHSWFYDVLGSHSLIYQFGYLTAVSWSISIEVFFYLLYAFAAPTLRRLSTPFRVLLTAAIMYGVTLVGYRWAVMNLGWLNEWGKLNYGPVADMTNGYQDSFVRWVVYFSPPSRLMEFGLGCLAAHLFVFHADQLKKASRLWNSHLFGWSLIAVILGTHFAVYLAPTIYFRAGSVLYAPLVALLLVYCVMGTGGPRRLLGARPMQWGGDCSYSIYLLHFIVLSLYAQPQIPSLEIVGWWLSAKPILMLSMVVCVARLVYLGLESPSRDVIRGRLTLSEAAKSILRLPIHEWRLIVVTTAVHLALLGVDRRILSSLGIIH